MELSHLIKTQAVNQDSTVSQNLRKGIKSWEIGFVLNLFLLKLHKAQTDVYILKQ